MFVFLRFGLTNNNANKWESITLDGDASILSILKELEFTNLEILESFSLLPRSSNSLSQMSCDMRQSLRLCACTPLGPMYATISLETTH